MKKLFYKNGLKVPSKFFGEVKVIQGLLTAIKKRLIISSHLRCMRDDINKYTSNTAIYDELRIFSIEKHCFDLPKFY